MRANSTKFTCSREKKIIDYAPPQNIGFTIDADKQSRECYQHTSTGYLSNVYEEKDRLAQ